MNVNEADILIIRGRLELISESVAAAVSAIESTPAFAPQAQSLRECVNELKKIRKELKQ